MNDSIPINVGESLRRLREAHNLSMRALAKTSGLSANALSMIERGKTSPSVSTLYKLADALRVPVMAFFGTPQEREQVIYLRALYRSRLPFVRGTWEGLGGEKSLVGWNRSSCLSRPAPTAVRARIGQTGQRGTLCRGARLLQSALLRRPLHVSPQRPLRRLVGGCSP